jgi:hypothetical protein
MLVLIISSWGFENIIGQQLASPQACLIGNCNKKSFTVEELLEAGGIEVIIPNMIITINVLRFSISFDIEEISYYTSQKNSGNFTEKQIALIKRAPKGTKIEFGDIQANINGRRHYLPPFSVRVK